MFPFDQSKLAFALHAYVDDTDKFFFVFVLNPFDLLPSFVFNDLARDLILFLKQLFRPLKLDNLKIFSLLFKFETLLKFLRIFILNHVQLGKTHFEAFFLFFLLMKKFLVPLIVRIHLFFVFPFLQFELFLVKLLQPFNLLMTFMFNTILFRLYHAVFGVILCFLAFKLSVELIDLFLGCT